MNIYNFFKSAAVSFLSVILIPALVLSAPNSNPKKISAKNNSKVSQMIQQPPSEEGKNMRYLSSLDQNSLERQFKELMAAKGFIHRRNKDIRSGTSRRLSFEKDNLVIDVLLSSFKGKGTIVSMTSYNKSEVMLDLKDAASAMKKPSVKLPSYKEEDKSKAVSFKPVNEKVVTAADINMEIPAPAKCELLKESVPEPFIGIGGAGQFYQSQVDSPKEVENFYRANLKKMGFKEIQNKSYMVINFQRFRFESSNMAVELFLSPLGDNGSRFIVVKYMDKDGMSKVEANPLYMYQMPENDNAGGSDLNDVPRPPDSVRQSGGTQNESDRVSYSTPENVLQTLDFYKKEMPSLGWKLSKEVSIGKTNEDYANEHKGVGFVRSVPIGTKLDLADIVKNSYALEFKSDKANVQIMIYPNYIDPSAGSMVDIEYVYTKVPGR